MFISFSHRLPGSASFILLSILEIFNFRSTTLRMNRIPTRFTPGMMVGITYTATDFEDRKQSIVEFTKDLAGKNHKNGIHLTRGAVNAAFEANVSKVFAEGHPMRNELLQQVSTQFPLVLMLR